MPTAYAGNCAALEATLEGRDTEILVQREEYATRSVFAIRSPAATHIALVPKMSRPVASPGSVRTYEEDRLKIRDAS